MQQNFKIVEVEIQDIVGCPVTEVFSYGQEDENLYSSIEKIGLINYPIVSKSGSEYEVICGKKRIQALRKLKNDKVGVKLWDRNNLTDIEKFNFAFFENASSRTFNIIELAGIVKILAEIFKFELSQIDKMYFSEIGTKSGTKNIEQLLNISKFEKKYKDFILKWNLSAAIAEKFSNFGKKDLEKIFELIEPLQIHGGKLKQFMDYVYEICRMEKTTAFDLLSSVELQNIFDSKKITMSQKQAKIIGFLYRRKHPVLSGLEQDFLDNSKGMTGLPSGTFYPPQNFEGDELAAKFIFRKIEELDGFCSAVNLPENRKKINKLLGLL